MSCPAARGVVLLAGPGDSTWIVADALWRRGWLRAVVLEDAPSRSGMLRRRARRLGWGTAAGQLAFLPVAAALRRASRRRIDEICDGAGMQRRVPTGVEVRRVPSVNDGAAVTAIAGLRPSVVVVNGTRIIAPRVLDEVGRPFVNLHAGITPAYRGVHGGYWALANGDPEHCGVTVHLIDRGIDTGRVLAQARISPGRRDNFATYPYLQLAAGLPLLAESVASLLEGRLVDSPVDLPSRLWSHPTLAQYLAGRRRHVR